MAELSAVARKFVLHWGEMGTRWGISRTVAQIHALLYIWPTPLHAEEIAQTLSVARSNVSTSLRELQGWGVVHVVHVLGDRRDYFQSMRDAWEMFRIILDQRMKREIEPTVALLRDCVEQARGKGAAEAHVRQRLGHLLEFFDAMTRWYQQVYRLPIASVMRLVRMGDRIGRWIGREK
jgi:DNA-binding transcriptional regulator GbsR (MarR family)